MRTPSLPPRSVPRHGLRADRKQRCKASLPLRELDTQGIPSFFIFLFSFGATRDGSRVTADHISTLNSVEGG